MSNQIQNYSVAEACIKGCICRSTIYELWAQGKGPRKFKIGRKTLIRACDLEAWINEMAGVAQ